MADVSKSVIHKFKAGLVSKETVVLFPWEFHVKDKNLSSNEFWQNEVLTLETNPSLKAL